VELNLPILAQSQPDVVAGEEVFALGAEAHFTQRPPLLERVCSLKKLELSSDSFGEFSHWKAYTKMA